MHDNALSHKAAFTREVLRVNNIQPMVWPAFSPDLNPTEAVWSEMKDFIEAHYPDLENGWERMSAEHRLIILLYPQGKFSPVDPICGAKSDPLNLVT